MAIHDPKADAQSVLKELKGGGIAILPHDVAYGIWGHTAASMARIYAAKKRSPQKTSGNIGNLDLFKELYIVDQRATDYVRAVIEDFGLPISTVAPFRADHPYYRDVDPAALAVASRAGTLDLLLNAGPLHNELARLSAELNFPIMGSSANVSLTGSKFRLEDIEAEIRAVAGIAIDYGLCRYHNPGGIGSTIIDIVNWKTLHHGPNFEQLRDILQRHFKIDLGPAPSTVR